MTDTTEVTEAMIDSVTGKIIDQKQLAERQLVQDRERVVSLLGPGGLLNQLTKNVLGTALEAEPTEHLGYEHVEVPIAENVRNGTRPKTALTEIGPVGIEVLRDREGSFEPVIVMMPFECDVRVSSKDHAVTAFMSTTTTNPATATPLCGTQLVRLHVCPRTRAYAAKRRSEGKSPKDILRCLKRAIAREIYHLLTTPPAYIDPAQLRQLRLQSGYTLTQAADTMGCSIAKRSCAERSLLNDREFLSVYRALLEQQATVQSAA
ncbi:transposase [Arthrobacter echini]|uniref:transposase n=1 Tax=Arthrobacter echini TaxID=1529066 RepID=UPI001FE76B5C|nr:transposase [Arthrobacter echini]